MKAECILVRVGEQALKSEQVGKIFDRILLRNMKAALKGIKYEIKREPNRTFIYTDDTKKTVNKLKRVFGITSLSPCFVCPSNIEDIKKISKKIFKVPKGKTFAVRARRAGSHKFTSQDIASKVGYIITGKADLSNPDKELFIECRQKKTYIFTEKILGPGGLPLGSGGHIFGLLKNEEDMVACWMMMKRGCEIFLISNEKSLTNKLKTWYIGPKLEVFAKMPKKEAVAMTMGEKTYKSLRKKPDLLILRPLVALDYKKLTQRIG